MSWMEHGSSEGITTHSTRGPVMGAECRSVVTFACVTHEGTTP